MHGQFIWYELVTPDVDAAKKFYPRFTGWGIQPFDKDYTMFTSGGVPIAGVLQLTDAMRGDGIPPNWMPYVESSNVDETIARATSLGGRLRHGPEDVPNTGRIAVLQDPQGAAFGIYTPNNPGGAWDGTAVVGRPSWHELMTTDDRAAFEFYRALFGWDKNGEMDMGGGQMYAMYGHGEKMYGGMFTMTSEMAGMHPFWLVYIHVKDVAKAVTTATKAGATVHRPQMDIPGGSIAILGDPQGAGYAVHHANPVPNALADVKPAVKKAAKTAKRVAKKVAKAAKQLTKQVATAARKAEKKVAKKVRTAMKRGTKAAAKKTSARKSAKPAKTTARPKAKARKAARKSAPNARKRSTASSRTRARRR